MSRHEKSLKRLQQTPSDFTWNELRTLMSGFDYELRTTGGSGRKFFKGGATFMIHEPHPHRLLKAYQMRALVTFLRKEGDIE